jgi:hypothetical protein
MASEEETLVMSLSEGFRRLGKEGKPSAELCRTPLIGVPSVGETHFGDACDDTSVTNELPRQVEVRVTRKTSAVSPQGTDKSSKQVADPRRGGRKNSHSVHLAAKTPVSTTQKILRRSRLSQSPWRLWLLALLGGALVGLFAAMVYRRVSSVKVPSPEQLENSVKQPVAIASTPKNSGKDLQLEAQVGKPGGKLLAPAPRKQSPPVGRSSGPSSEAGKPNRGTSVQNPSAPSVRKEIQQASANSDLARRALELLLSGEQSEAIRLYESLERQEDDDQMAHIWRHFSSGARQLEKRGAAKSPSVEEE